MNSQALVGVGEIVRAEGVANSDRVIGRVDGGGDRGCNGAPGERDIRFVDVGDVFLHDGGQGEGW